MLPPSKAITYTKAEHEASHQILWRGAHLDGTLTVVYCACCNAEQPSDIPDTVIVDFALQAMDGTTYGGTAAITMNTDGVSKLLEVITASYTQFLVDARKEQSCTLQ